jgi:hypothetical protein
MKMINADPRSALAADAMLGNTMRAWVAQQKRDRDAGANLVITTPGASIITALWSHRSSHNLAKTAAVGSLHKMMPVIRALEPSHQGSIIYISDATGQSSHGMETPGKLMGLPGAAGVRPGVATSLLARRSLSRTIPTVLCNMTHTY